MLRLPLDKYHIGTPLPTSNVVTSHSSAPGARSDSCSFVVYGKAKKSGEVMTPTYPGIYPKNMHCAYKFIGEANQRMRLEFRDFDLFYGGAQ